MWKAIGIGVAILAVWLYEMGQKKPASAIAAQSAAPSGVMPMTNAVATATVPVSAPVSAPVPIALLGPVCSFHDSSTQAVTSSSPTVTASGVPISSLATTSMGNTIFGQAPGASVNVLPVNSQVFAIWPQTTPADWQLIGPSQTSIGNYWWGNSALGVKTNVSPNGLAAFGGEIL